MSTPNEKSPETGTESPEVISDINEKLDAASSDHEKDLSEKEKTLIQKVSEIGEEAVAKLKGAFADVDKDELLKSVNRHSIQRSLASTLDGFNSKVQTLLAPKEESGADLPAPVPAADHTMHGTVPTPEASKDKS